MPRQKLPVRATFSKVAKSPEGHAFPFHVVGMIEDEKRYVVTGLTDEQIKEVYEELGKYLNNGNETHSV